MSSRKPTPKTLIPQQTTIPQAPLSNRNHNEPYYQQSNPYRKSKDFQNGIFTKEINKLSERKRERDPPPLQIEVVEPMGNLSAARSRNSQRVFGAARESRTEYHQLSSQKIHEDSFQQKLQQLKQQMYQNMDEFINYRINQINNSFSGQLSKLVTQINIGNQKKSESISIIKEETVLLKNDINQLKMNLNELSREQEEKIQNLVMQVAAIGGNKKSKIYGDYAVDLKNSFQGQNSSFSGNTENPNSKLVNEAFLQLDSLKKQLEDSKEQIEQLTIKINSQKVQSQTTKVEVKQALIGEQQVIKMIKDTLKEQRKTLKIEQKIEGLQNSLRELERVAFNQEMNIKGINEQLAHSINNQINPKIKKIQSSLIDIYTKIDSQELDKQVSSKVKKEIQEKLKNNKVVSVRGCTNDEKGQLAVRGMDEDMISFKDTYLLDQENYLLDSQGRYLVEQINGVKERIKIERDLIYLLQLKGLQISTCS